MQVESNQGSAGHSITLIYEPSGSSAPGGAGKGQGRVERGQGRRPGLPCAGAGGVGADTSRGMATQDEAERTLHNRVGSLGSPTHPGNEISREVPGVLLCDATHPRPSQSQVWEDKSSNHSSVLTEQGLQLQPVQKRA